METIPEQTQTWRIIQMHVKLSHLKISQDAYENLYLPTTLNESVGAFSKTWILKLAILIFSRITITTLLAALHLNSSKSVRPCPYLLYPRGGEVGEPAPLSGQGLQERILVRASGRNLREKEGIVETCTVPLLFI